MPQAPSETPTVRPRRASYNSDFVLSSKIGRGEKNLERAFSLKARSTFLTLPSPFHLRTSERERIFCLNLSSKSVERMLSPDLRSSAGTNYDTSIGTSHRAREAHPLYRYD